MHWLVNAVGVRTMDPHFRWEESRAFSSTLSVCNSQLWVPLAKLCKFSWFVAGSPSVWSGLHKYVSVLHIREPFRASLQHKEEMNLGTKFTLPLWKICWREYWKAILSVTVQGSSEVLGGWQAMCLFIQFQQGLRVFDQSQFRHRWWWEHDCNQHAKEVQR